MKTSYRANPRKNDDGFTPGQKVTLAIMILMIICVFGVLAVLLLANTTPQKVVPNAGTPIAYITLTRSPTLTPVPVVTATPIPGWGKFTGGGAEIWLPGSYQGGDVTLERELILQKLEAAGADSSTFDLIRQDFDRMGTVIFAFDASGTEVFFTEVYISKQEVGSASLNAAVDGFVSQVQIKYRVVAREPVALSSYKVERVMVDRKDVLADSAYSTYGTRVVYLIKVDSVVWIVQYVTDRDQVNSRLANFDRSIQTFALAP